MDKEIDTQNQRALETLITINFVENLEEKKKRCG